VRVRVVAGAVFDPLGRVLIAERPAGKHLSGRWEFPGGKVDGSEAHEQALARELREELGIEVLGSEHLMTLEHAYPDREVELHLFVVTRWAGAVRPLDGQGLRWVPLAGLGAEDILEADRPFVDALQRRGPPANMDRTAAPPATAPAGA
jgi:8-oxo-dGTP diphosphatase